MKKSYFVILMCVLLGVLGLSGCDKKKEIKVDQFSEPVAGETVAEIVIKGYGSIYVKFFDEAAPKAVENFVTHAKNGYYDGLTFHRIIEDFMIQGGDPTGKGYGGESIWGEDFEDEFNQSLQPLRGALCMANSGKNTNGSQFFIVQSSNTYGKDILKDMEKDLKISFNDKAVDDYGKIGGTPWLFRSHTVFGQVYEGYEVLDEVAGVEKLDAKQGIPAEEVIIETINISEFK